MEDERSYRKILITRTYTLIFRKILPNMLNGFKIGNTEHAKRINEYSKRRSHMNFEYDDISYLALLKDDNFYSFEVRENNFNNWINGTSNPKNLIIINSILEYVIETCKSEETLMLLKYEILSILKSDELNRYVGNMITDIINNWIIEIDSDNAETLFRALKEVLYLLKDKDKFIPLLMLGNRDFEGTPLTKVTQVTTGKSDLVSNSDESVKIEKTDLSINFENPGYFFKRFERIVTNSMSLKLVIFASSVLLFSVLIYLITAIPTTSPRYKNFTSSGSMKAQELLKDEGKTENKILPPKITNPVTNSLLPMSDIKLEWEPENPSDSFTVVVTNIDSWVKVYTRTEIKEVSLILSKQLFDVGGNYRIYVLSTVGKVESVPNYIDIRFEKLHPPIIKSPVSGSLIQNSDLVIQWDPVALADSYTVVITNTDS